MKNSTDTSGNGTRDLPVCNVVPQATALPRAPKFGNSNSEISDLETGVLFD